MCAGLCCKLHSRRLHFLFALQQSSINNQLFVENCDLCLPHLHSTPPLGRSSSECCHDVWYRKTRMVKLPDAEKILKIRLLISTEFTNVMDGQTDGHRMTA